MARLYGEIASSALMTFDKSFARANGQPLDSTEVYYSLAAARTYAAGDGAYIGQKIVVIENNVVTHYSIEDTAGTLKELGSKPVGDGQSIDVAADGTVSIHGFDELTGAEIGYLPRVKKVVDSPANEEEGLEEVSHLEIEWAPVSAIVQGDGNSVTTVTAKDGSVAVTDTASEDFEGHKYEIKVKVADDETNKLQLTENGLFVAETDLSNYYNKDHVDGISNKVTAIEDVVGKAAEGENEATGLVKAVADNAAAIDAEVTARGEADATTLADAKAYTNEEIGGLTVSIEKVEEVDHIVIKDKSGKTIASANASTFVQDSFLDDVTYDSASGKITFTWTMGDGSTKTDEVNVADFVETYTAGNGLTLTDNEFAVDTTVIATVEELNKVKETAEAAQTAEEVSDAIDAKIESANLSQYAIKSDVEGALEGKVDNVELDNYYTKEEVDSKGYAVATDVADTYATKDALSGVEAVANAAAPKTYVDTELGKKANAAAVYTKTEIDLKIGTPGTPSSGTAGEEGYVAAVDGTGVFASTYSKAEINALLDEIEGGSTESAASVGRQLDEYKSTNNNRVSLIEQKNNDQDTAINAAQSTADKGVADAATAQQTADSANVAIAALTSGQIKTNKDDIAALTTRVTNAEATLTDYTTTVKPQVETNTADIKILKETTIPGINTTLASKADASSVYVKAETYSQSEVNVLLSDKANAADVYTTAQTDAKIAEEFGKIDLTPYAKADDVYTKTEADAAFMTETEVDDRINALIVGSDPEGGKAITNIQNLVKYVDENAGEIAALITATGANTDKLAGIDGTVKGYVDTALTAIIQPKASEEVTVAEDGTLGIGTVNVNKLVQTEGDELILFGGTAAVTA